ncbi:MAG: hypothetical protein LBS81_04630 [Endomicrobium sp.]|jgi:hypothetical protein|nr:hypothetical protein [Endomicrobium sp.]
MRGGVYNRDYLEDNAYLNFNGLKFKDINIFPVRIGISRIETIIPKADENKSNLISLIDDGQVLKYTRYIETNLNFCADFPQLYTIYSRCITDRSKIKRLEDKEVFSRRIGYNNPLEFTLLPTNITVDARTENSYYKVYPAIPIAHSDSFLGLDSIKKY